MKKKLQNILALSLGLMTTVAFAQDWNADSRTRIDMSGDNDYRSTEQRVTVGTTWGGSDWGIHVSSDVNYTIGGGSDASMGIYEAYASTDLFGMANMTIGRQALSYGSGALMSGNDWCTSRTTWDGMTFDLGLSDVADITVGYHSSNSGGENEDDAGNMHTNISGEFVYPSTNFKKYGEIIISYPRAIYQARQRKNTVKSEIGMLMVHGILHLMGYDHDRFDNEIEMWSKQEELLATLKL